MIKTGALVMGLVMAAVSAGTYFGLELLPPGAIPPPIGRVIAEDHPDTPAPAPEPQVASAVPAPAPAPAAAAEPTEQDLAEEPPPPVQHSVADEPEPSLLAAAAPASEPAAEAPKPAPKPAAEQAPAPEPEAVASARPARNPPESDVIKPWWPTDTSQMPATQLKLQYAGQVQGQGAIALLFSAPVKIDSVKAHASVRTAKGETVSGEWTLGKNPKLAVFSGLAAGRYTVILQPQVADQQGYMLDQMLKGPVYIKQ